MVWWVWSKRQAAGSAPGARKRRRTRRRRQPGSRTDGPLRTLRRLSAGQRQPDQDGDFYCCAAHQAAGPAAGKPMTDWLSSTWEANWRSFQYFNLYRLVLALFFLALLFPTSGRPASTCCPRGRCSLTAATPRRPSAAWCWRRTGSAISIRSCRRR